MNLVEPEIAKTLPKEEFSLILEDILQEFGKIAEVLRGWIVYPSHCVIGAEPGSVFIEVEDKEKAEKLLEENCDLRYKGRLLRMTCIPEDVYVDNFANLANLC